MRLKEQNPLLENDLCDKLNLSRAIRRSVDRAESLPGVQIPAWLTQIDFIENVEGFSAEL